MCFSRNTAFRRNTPYCSNLHAYFRSHHPLNARRHNATSYLRVMSAIRRRRDKCFETDYIIGALLIGQNPHRKSSREHGFKFTAEVMHLWDVMSALKRGTLTKPVWWCVFFRAYRGFYYYIIYYYYIIIFIYNQSERDIELEWKNPLISTTIADDFRHVNRNVIRIRCKPYCSWSQFRAHVLLRVSKSAVLKLFRLSLTATILHGTGTKKINKSIIHL